MVSEDKEPTIMMTDTERKKNTPSAGTIGTESPSTVNEEPMKTETIPQVDDATIEKQDVDSSSPAVAAEAGAKPEQEVNGKAIEEMTRGMVYASLAITDDKEDTLKKVGLLWGVQPGSVSVILSHMSLDQVGKANPWQVEALKIVTGSEEAAHKPLTEILDEYMNLKVDKFIDISGVTKGKLASAMLSSIYACAKSGLTAFTLLDYCARDRRTLFGHSRIHCAQRYNHCTFVSLLYLGL